MKQDQILGIVRALLSALGGWLLGKNLFGTTVDESLWQELLGVAMGIASVVMSILSKTLTLEMAQGVARQVISFFGGIGVGKGLITAQTLTLVMGLVPVIAAWLAGLFNKKVNVQTKENPSLIVPKLST